MALKGAPSSRKAVYQHTKEREMPLVFFFILQAAKHGRNRTVFALFLIEFKCGDPRLPY
jgi:hypothetical protein